jgi:pyruvate dehydrogenase E1 component
MDFALADPSTIEIVSLIDERLRWLSAWTIHNANHLRDSRDGVKVGGHQASCASMSTIVATLYFRALRTQDRVASGASVARKVIHRVQRTASRSTFRPAPWASASP